MVDLKKEDYHWEKTSLNGTIPSWSDLINFLAYYEKISMKVASLFSGGKDSTYATFVAMQRGWDVKYLITLVPERSDSWMFHYPCVELTKLQAKAMGIRHVYMKTSGVKEKELEDLKRALSIVKDEIEGVVCGAVASEYQKHRIDMVCEELGLRSFAPLWHKDPEKLLMEEVNLGFEIMLTSVSCDGLSKEWVGKVLDQKSVKRLLELSKKYRFNPAGEGGEFESFVLNCPIFNRRIEFPEFEVVWDDSTNSGFVRLAKDLSSSK